MTTSEWKALIRMTSSSNNSFIGHYKGVPVEVTSNSTLTRVYIHSNHDNIVTPRTFMVNDELPTLYRKVFKELYRVWHTIQMDNLPF